ncbi:L-type lectin-domain containing receptor kinase S.4-like [Pyrus ussuriensis x Pyrus communis]|uniref:L-type lectin-domain containing receptor kinase S.4-like n=1 Tax=Pyrus ussuriensis x Pyrus communis TaxID=2448454 RepID=A0A5N5HTU4_9ROSA|nr:L-type lectin-domain containing receptor kinase S.4-like [Pyrus ussuriensis x Pyrus communis]
MPKYGLDKRRAELRKKVACLASWAATEPISSSEPKPLTNSSNPNFDSESSFLGDAELAGDGFYVNLTRSSVSSSGLLLRRKPFKFVDRNLSNPPSFSTEFAFSMTLGSGDNLLAVFALGDLGSRLLDFGSFVSLVVGNVSKLNLMLSSGEKLKCWIDYDATSKRLEIMLGKADESRYIIRLTTPKDSGRVCPRPSVNLNFIVYND